MILTCRNPKSIVAWVARKKRPRRIGNLSKVHHISLAPGMLSELAVPLLSSDDKAVVGVLNVESPKQNAFTKHHQSYLITLARRVRIVVQRATLSEVHQTIARKVLEMDNTALLTYTVQALANLLHVSVCSVWLVDPGMGICY